MKEVIERTKKNLAKLISSENAKENPDDLLLKILKEELAKLMLIELMSDKS